MKKNNLLTIPFLLFIVLIFTLVSFIPSEKSVSYHKKSNYKKPTNEDIISKKELSIKLIISDIKVTQSEIAAKL